MEQKKISFGFSKLSKKINIIPSKLQEEKKVELIECLEGQSIKIKDAIEEVKGPLVIPIKDNQKNLLDRIRDAKKRDRPLDPKDTEPEDNRPDSELSVDELAARQLIREAKQRLEQGNNRNNEKVSVLPLNNETLSLDGEKESTLEDYESVPISDYGFALLRGMGWKDGMTIGKNTSKMAPVSAPELRPKGLGLGASKVIQSELPNKKPVDKDGNELILVKGAYAKLIAGIGKGNYCEVQGFDEEAGRVIVKVYPKGDNMNVNEFMLVPVTKEEFSRGSKILNNAKYEEYLEISDKKIEKLRIKEENSKNIKQEYSEVDNNKTYDKDLKKSPISSDNERDSHSKQRSNHNSRNKHRSDSADSDYETEKTSQKQMKSKYRDRSRSRSPVSNSNKKDRSRRRSESSDDDYHEKDRKSSKHTKSKYKQKDRDDSRLRSESSDSEYYEKDKKSSKHTKSKYQDKNRDESRSREKNKKDKKHKSKYRKDSSSSESDSRRDRRKKNKCKSRHRRNSSSSTDRKSYRSKK